MMISTYSPYASGTCPKCGGSHEDLLSRGGNLAFGDRYLLLSHPACGTEWTFYLDHQQGDQIEITAEGV